MKLVDVFKDGVVSTVTNAVGLLASFLSVRFFVSLYPYEEYGVWVVLNAVVSWFLVVDFGLGQAVQNFVVRKRIAYDRKGLAAGVAVSTLILLLVALVIILLQSVIMDVSQNAAVLNLKNITLAGQLAFGVSVFVAGFALAAALRVGGSLMRSVHKSNVVNAQAMLKNLLPLVGILLALSFGFSLSWVLIFVGVGTAVLEAGLFVIGLQTLRPLPVPDMRECSEALTELLSPSLFFFLCQIGMNLLILTQALIVSHTMSIAEAGRFNPTYRLWFIGLTFLTSACLPMVARFNEAFHKPGSEEVARSFRRIGLFVALAAASIALGYALFAPLVIRLWVGRGFVFGTWVYFALAASAFPAMMTTFYASVLMGLERTKVLAAICGAAGGLFVVLGWVGATLYGFVGLVLSMAVVYWLLMLILAISTQRAVRARFGASATGLVSAANAQAGIAMCGMGQFKRILFRSWGK